MPAPHFRRSNHLSVLVAICATAVMSCGNGGGHTDAENAYNAFLSALQTAEPDQIWQLLSDDTRVILDGAIDSLEAMTTLIEQLQPSDQLDARVRSGVELLDTASAPGALFERLVDLSVMPPLDERGRYRAGLRVSDVIQVAPDIVIITTRAGQEFEMVLQPDGGWRVREPFRGLLNEAVANLHDNRESLERAVQLFGRGAQELDELRRYGLLDD